MICRRTVSTGRSLVLAAASLAFLSLASCRFEVEDDAASGNDLQLYAEEMLAESAAAWNEGELEKFLDDFLESPTTTYIGEEGLSAGYDEIRERYAPSFETGAMRDSLRFESVRTRRLGAIYGLVTARWVMVRDDTVTGSGPLTLVVRRVAGAWKIIHDHSSTGTAAARRVPLERSSTGGDSQPVG